MRAAPGQAGMLFLNFTNRPGPLTVAWLGHAVGGVVLCLVLIPAFGVIGAAVALVIAALSYFLSIKAGKSGKEKP